jgi:hypothetical protein
MVHVHVHTIPIFDIMSIICSWQCSWIVHVYVYVYIYTHSYVHVASLHEFKYEHGHEHRHKHGHPHGHGYGQRTWTETCQKAAMPTVTFLNKFLCSADISSRIRCSVFLAIPRKFCIKHGQFREVKTKSENDPASTFVESLVCQRR